MDPYWIRPSPVGPRQVVLIGLVVVFASVGFSSSETRGQTNFEDEEAETVVLSSTKVDPVDQDARTLANSWTDVAAAALENRQLPGHHLRRNRRDVTSSSSDALESSRGGTSSSPSPCPGGCGTGRCILQKDKYLCECPHGKERPGCENDIRIQDPAFNGESYLMYTFPKKIVSLSLEMSLKVESTEDAVILGFSHKEKTKFHLIMLGIKDGTLVFQFASKYSSGFVSTPSDHHLETNKWMHISLNLSKDINSMDIDGDHFSENKFISKRGHIASSGNISIGGYVDADDSLPKVDRGFKGCMKEIKINGKDIFQEQPLQSRNVTQCMESCQTNPCNERDQCSDDPTKPEGYTCKCKEGYSGGNKLSRESCPAKEKVLLNTTWNFTSTAKWDSITFMCSGETSFNWTCCGDAYWDDTPDLSFCRNHERLFMPPNSTTTAPAAENLTALAKSISHEHIFPGDVFEIIRGLMYLQEQLDQDIKKLHNKTHGQSLRQNYLRTLVNVTSEVLKEPQVWHFIPEEDVKVASTKLQECVVDAALKTLESFLKNRTTNYPGETVDVVIVSQPPEYYETGENRTYKHPSNDGTSILLPDHFYNGGTEIPSSNVSGSEIAPNEGSGLVNVTFNSYSTIHCQTNDIPCTPFAENGTLRRFGKDEIFRRQVNSLVIGAVIGPGRHWRAKLDEYYVEVNLTHIYNGTNYELYKDSVECVWWDTSKNDWVSGDGCKIYSHDKYYTICHCFHLTNLAVLMDIGGLLVTNPTLNNALGWITILGCSLSIIFLVVGFVSFLLLKIDYKKKNAEVAARKCLTRMHLCGCLLAAYLVLLLGLEATKYKIFCAAIAAVLQFFFLASFTWSAIEAFNLYLAVMVVLDTKFNFITEKLYLLVGYIFPAVIVVTNLVSFQGEGFGTDEWCWLDRSTVMWSFVGCIAIIMLINLVAFVAVMHKVWIVGRGNASNLRNTTKPTCRKVIGSMTIFAVFGLTWITGFFYQWKGTEALAIIFALLNSLQGFAIVFLELVCDEKKRNDLLVVLHIKAQNKSVPTNVRRAIARSLRMSRGPVPEGESNLETAMTTVSNSNTDA